MRNRRHAAGFTLIELIVVIVILGVLAATALPRFINLKDDAERAVIESTVGALASAHALYVAKAVLCGSSYSPNAIPLAFAVAVTSSDSAQCGVDAAPNGHAFDGNQIRNGLMQNPSANLFRDGKNFGNVIEFVSKTGRTITITRNATTGAVGMTASPSF